MTNIWSLNGFINDLPLPRASERNFTRGYEDRYRAP